MKSAFSRQLKFPILGSVHQRLPTVGLLKLFPTAGFSSLLLLFLNRDAEPEPPDLALFTESGSRNRRDYFIRIRGIWIITRMLLRNRNPPKFTDSASLSLNHRDPQYIAKYLHKIKDLPHRRRQSSEVRGANVNLCQPTPCQKLKTHRIWSTIFWDGSQIHI